MDKANAIAKELAKNREHKRNLIATVEFLRSEMEQGRIHLRVNTDPLFQEDLEGLKPKSYIQGWQRHPQFRYVNPVKGVFSSSKESWQFILVDELFDEDGVVKDEIIINIAPK